MYTHKHPRLCKSQFNTSNIHKYTCRDAHTYIYTYLNKHTYLRLQSAVHHFSAQHGVVLLVSLRLNLVEAKRVVSCSHVADIESSHTNVALKHTATPCNTLQLSATLCNNLQDLIGAKSGHDFHDAEIAATHCNTLQHTATHG